VAGVYGEINSRDDFFRVLREASEIAQRFCQQQPKNMVMQAIASQLTTMQSWTDAGRTPSERQRQQITVGLIAAREFETADGMLGQLREKVFALNNYFEKWPTDEQAANASDDDFWEDDEDEETRDGSR